MVMRSESTSQLHERWDDYVPVSHEVDQYPFFGNGTELNKGTVSKILMWPRRLDQMKEFRSTV